MADSGQKALKLVFMGSPAFAVPTLEALLASHHQVVAVYSQPPKPAGRGQQLTPTSVHQLAESRGIPVYTPTSLKDAAVQAEFASHKADAAIVAAYGLLLPKPILDAYPLGCINVHPSLLPRWRGAAPLQRTIMAGDKETGICIMQMNEGLDTGDVLECEPYSIPEGMDTGGLHDTLAKRAGPLVLKVLQGLQEGTVIPTPQATDGVVHAPKISKAESRIDWSQSAETIVHHIRGLSPFPGAFFEYQGEQIKVFGAQTRPANTNTAPGTVVTGDDSGLAIAARSGVVLLQTLQRPGKKRMSADEMLRGFPIKIGAIFN